MPMNSTQNCFIGIFALTAGMTLWTQAATVWTGPKTSFTQPGIDPTLAENQDRLTSNVWITRGGDQGLFNAKSEIVFSHFSSPADTAWADGTTANYATLNYTNWNYWAKTIHGGPPATVGVNAVVHLISEDIYLDVKITSWGSGGIGGFSYDHSTPASSQPPPSVSITNPVSGAYFAVPATVTIFAAATVSGGTVTNVVFLANGSPLGSDQTPPFSFTASNLNSGFYALTAVATAGGVSATSAPVNLSVLAPGPISVGPAGLGNGQISFNFSGTGGLKYVVQGSSNLLDWVSLATNVSLGNPIPFSQNILPDGAKFYRVMRLPNP